VKLPDSSAEHFTERLDGLIVPGQAEKYLRYFKTGPGEYAEGDEFIGVPMGKLFGLAKEFIEMTPDQIELLLESPIHESRAGGLSVMDKQARLKRTTQERREALYELYMRRLDRVNNWDLVDVACPHVVGGYLFKRSHRPLYDLAVSPDMWARRTAIVSTSFFIRKDQLDDTFAIAELLLTDDQDLIHKASGGWLREAGRHDRERLVSFLDQHAAAMPRTMLRYSIEHFDKEDRTRYLSM